MAIADKITSIENHLTADYEGLENLGADLTGIDKNIQNIRTCLDTIYSSLPKVTGEGTEVTLTPTKKGKLGLVEKGNSTQEGTPTPSTPIPIKSVTGNNNVVVNNGNILDNVWQLGKLNLTTGAIESSTTRIVTTNLQPVKPNTTYTFGDTTFTKQVCFYKSDKTFRSSGTLQAGQTQRISPTANDYYIRVSVVYDGTGVTPDINTKLMLAEGTEELPYIAPQTKPLNLGSIELNGISTYKDAIFKNIPSNPYYNNTLTEGSWYKKNAIRVTTLPAAVSVNTETIFDVTCKYVVYRYQTQDANRMFYSNNILYNFDCVKVSKANGVANTYSGYTIKSNFVAIVDNNDTVATVDQKLQGAQFNYVLETPTYTEITDTDLISQLEAIDNMQGYNGTTIITSTYDNSNAQMIIQASALKGE